MAPLTPHWVQPSHPDVQEVVVNEAEFSTKSISRVTLPPFALFATLASACTLTDEATYATVQVGPGKHLNLNSDLLYINHSCEPSLIFDTANHSVLAGPKGLRKGEELTFFYPSTEYAMVQPFDCNCGAATCRGRIAGAAAMTPSQLEGVWLSGHIRALLSAADAGLDTPAPSSPREGAAPRQAATTVDTDDDDDDATAQALRDALVHAEKVVAAARRALVSYVGAGEEPLGTERPGCGARSSRRGRSARELGGEMGGDTASAVGA